MDTGDESVDLLVVGAGPAGVSAVRSFREHGGHGRVVVFSDDPDAPYERPPLSKDYLRGEAQEADTRLLEPGELKDLDVEMVATRATVLDPAGRVVDDGSGRRLSYQWCLLATGASPVRLPVPGADDPRIRQLRTLDDARRLRAAATSSGASTAVVIGSGFIGCEAAVSLSRLGLDVTLVTDEEAPQRGRLGAAAADRITGWLDDEKVRLMTGATITSLALDDDTDRVAVRTRTHGDVEADVVLMAVGIAPGSDLARSAGLRLENDRIVTDARMRTSMPGVLAAGDVAMAFNTAAGRPLAVEHWGEALRMGEIAGATAAGADDEWRNAPGFWSQVGDRQLKYAAWGDGFADAHLQDHGDGAFTIWYTDASGATVGVLTHEADEDYERGQTLVETAAAPPFSV